jgi:hypothetical protein
LTGLLVPFSSFGRERKIYWIADKATRWSFMDYSARDTGYRVTIFSAIWMYLSHREISSILLV